MAGKWWQVLVGNISALGLIEEIKSPCGGRGGWYASNLEKVGRQIHNQNFFHKGRRDPSHIQPGTVLTLQTRRHPTFRRGS
jgi:hypothetical protein